MKSFLHGRKPLAVAPLHARNGAPRTSTGGPRLERSLGSRTDPRGAGAKCSSGEANVEVIKEGDKVVRMVVTCSCGERIEVECLYPAG